MEESVIQEALAHRCVTVNMIGRMKLTIQTERRKEKYATLLLLRSSKSWQKLAFGLNEDVDETVTRERS